MKIQLCRYTRPISPTELPALIDRPSSVAAEAINGEVDLGSFMTRLDGLLDGLDSGEIKSRTALDAELVEPLHRSMAEVPTRIACDMRMWHWLCIQPSMRRFVLHRWFDGSIEGDSGSAAAGRFLGSATLNGMSRNALARLYWCGEQLVTNGNYELAQAVISKQDFFQAIFERKLGNYPPAARACARLLQDEVEDTWREVLRRLNYELSTTVLEVTSEDDLLNLISGFKAEVEDRPS